MGTTKTIIFLDEINYFNGFNEFFFFFVLNILLNVEAIIITQVRA